jgi:DNA polymerase III delta prime subunit
MTSWLDKHIPSELEEFIGYETIINNINKWIQVFSDNSKWYPEFRNALLLTGHSGVGKTLLAHLLLKKWNYTVMEFNASEIRTSKIVGDKLESILSSKAITDIVQHKNKSGIIMDELDGMEPKKECSAHDLQDYINFTKNDYITRLKINLRKTKKKMSESEIQKHIKTKRFINDNPIILITSNLNHNINSIMKDIIHITIPEPSSEQLLNVLKKIRNIENMNISDSILELCIPFCQKDYRKAVLLMESLYNSFEQQSINVGSIIKWLNSFSGKDIDMDIDYTIYNIFHSPDLTWDNLINMYYVDESFVPLIVHENFIDYIPAEIPYDKQLDICLDYYDYLHQSLLIKSNVFGIWDDFSSYIGIFTTVSTHSLLKPYLKNSDSGKADYQKSAIISKYNYRYYNMKFINYICKKMSINIDNFAMLSCILYYSTFINTEYLKNNLELCSNYKLTFKEVEKIIKLCVIYDDKKYTKKKCNELENLYLPMIANLELEETILI